MFNNKKCMDHYSAVYSYVADFSASGEIIKKKKLIERQQNFKHFSQVKWGLVHTFPCSDLEHH